MYQEEAGSVCYQRLTMIKIVDIIPVILFFENALPIGKSAEYVLKGRENVEVSKRSLRKWERLKGELSNKMKVETTRGRG